MTDIHPTAVVDPAAQLAADARVGPHCVVGPQVTLGESVVLHGHAVVEGRTRLARGCVVHPFAAVGTAPQDMKYQGEPSELLVGEGTVIREHVTVNTGTRGGGMMTRVGRGCLLMVGAHVAHDCQIGDGVIMANNATLGGHVVVEDHAFLGGLVAVHQFARIGRGAMIGGMSGVEHDVIPYGMAVGNRARLSGLNIVGLKRRGVAKSEIQALRTAYRRLFESEDDLFQDRLAQVADDFEGFATVRHIVAFIRADASRPLCRPKPGDVG